MDSSVTPNATSQGAFHNLIKEMRLSDPEKHFNFFRMTRETFDVLLEKVKHPPKL